MPAGALDALPAAVGGGRIPVLAGVAPVRRAAPALPVAAALTGLLPDGLRRGSTLSVTGSTSLLLALLGTACADGAWCALVGAPLLCAEAADEYGIELSRLAIVPEPGASWTTAVGALLDAVDVVAARPPSRLVPGDVRRLAARARTRDGVLICYGDWPGADVRLSARPGTWDGIGTGYGRLRARRVEVTATGRGRAARPCTEALWLPAATGGVASVVPAVHPAVRSDATADGPEVRTGGPSTHRTDTVSTDTVADLAS